MEGLLSPRPTPKLEDHPFSTLRDCLFNIFAATLHTGDRSSIRNLRTRHGVVTWTHYTTLHYDKYIMYLVFFATGLTHIHVLSLIMFELLLFIKLQFTTSTHCTSSWINARNDKSDHGLSNCFKCVGAVSNKHFVIEVSPHI